MLMSVIDGARTAPSYPELAGKRVLITGLTSTCGVDVARAFGEHKCRLVLQFAETSETMQTVAEIVAPAALDIKAYGPVGSATDDVVQFARAAAQAYGGLDVVVNLVSLAPAEVAPSATTADIENLVAARLALPFLLGQIIANRMSVVWTEGLLLNIAALAEPPNRTKQAFATVIKAALTGMTRAQAEEWATRGIRCNAITPRPAHSGAGPSLSGEPDMAALALYLASGRGKALSGCVFEAETTAS